MANAQTGLSSCVWRTWRPILSQLYDHTAAVMTRLRAMLADTPGQSLIHTQLGLDG